MRRETDRRPFQLGLVGQEHAETLLYRTFIAGRVSSLLFVGRDGVGKRTAALRFAQAVNCESQQLKPCGECQSCRLIARLNHPDVLIAFPVPQRRRSDDGDNQEPPPEPAEWNLSCRAPESEPSYHIPIGTVRWLCRQNSSAPQSARRRFIIILRADSLREQAANALLKTLEEPQSATSFILTTSHPGSLPPTIRSRCQTVRFAELTEEAITGQLVAAGADPKAASLAAALAEGSLGNAWRYLESPDSVLPPAVVDYFLNAASGGSRTLLSAIDQLRDISPAATAKAFIMLLRAALRIRLGQASALAAAVPGLAELAPTLQPAYLRRAIHHLLGRLEDSRLNVPADLFHYAVLNALRRTPGSEPSPGRP